MKSQLCLIVVIVCGVFGIIFFFPRASLPIFRLPNRCPIGQYSPAQKTQAYIERINRTWGLKHTGLQFQFMFPDDGWRFEENTIQEREEPISLPQYTYSLLLTDGVYDESRRSPSEVRLIIYPTFCNSENQWTEFLLAQGWKKSEGIRLARYDSGRTRSLSFFHIGRYHYEIETSIDPLNSRRSNEELLSLVSQFVFMKGIQND